MKKNKKIFLALFIILLIALSFFRESVFININAHMWYLYYQNDKSYLLPWLSFLKPLSYSQLYSLKWILTVFFSILFFSLTSIIIKLMFNEWKFIKWTLIVFCGFLSVAALSYTAGILFNNTSDGYIVSRFFIGLVQSPFLLIFLIPAFKLSSSNSGT